MATKNEKILGFAVGFGIGLSLPVESEDSQSNLIIRIRNGLIGGLIGYCASLILGEADDTVNYELFRGRKRVYHGIAYEDRIEKRFSEHAKRGKVFTRVKFDTPKPRSEALVLERKLIQRDRPTYNIQHNS